MDQANIDSLKLIIIYGEEVLNPDNREKLWMLFKERRRIGEKLEKYNIKMKLEVKWSFLRLQLVMIIDDWQNFSPEAIDEIATFMQAGKVIQYQNVVSIIETNGIVHTGNSMTPLETVWSKSTDDSAINLHIKRKGGKRILIITRDPVISEDPLMRQGDWPYLGTAIRELLTLTWESVQERLSQED